MSGDRNTRSWDPLNPTRLVLNAPILDHLPYGVIWDLVGGSQDLVGDGAGEVPGLYPPFDALAVVGYPG